jgi:twitching motility protein PilT
MTDHSLTDPLEEKKQAQKAANTEDGRHPEIPDPDAFLRSIVKLGVSDLHVKAGVSPRVRIAGQLKKLKREPLPREIFEKVLLSLISEEQQRTLREEGSVDFTYDIGGSDRFRMNIYQQESGLSIAARRVTRDIPAFEDLHLPPVVSKIAENRQGLVLIAGVTGSGKSTTMAAMIEHINTTRAEHILTIEDPIEFLFASKKSLINQREIGINVKDFPTALRALVREDPDVVLIGELRDEETFRAALQATDTGHLVFGTIHAANCAQCIGRLLDLFPEDERDAIRQSLAFNLKAIIAQGLIPTTSKEVSRLPINDILVNTPIVQKLIVEHRDSDLPAVIRSGDEGMQSFDDSLQRFIEQGYIDTKIAYEYSPNAEQLKMQLKGIRQGKGGILG